MQTVHMSESTAAEYAAVSKALLRKLRKLGLAPKYIKASRRIIYRQSDLDEWLNAGLVEPTEDKAVAQ